MKKYIPPPLSLSLSLRPQVRGRPVCQVVDPVGNVKEQERDREDDERVAVDVLLVALHKLVGRANALVPPRCRLNGRDGLDGARGSHDGVSGVSADGVELGDGILERGGEGGTLD
jgi:hypothetical protein